jgi:ABC-type polysaccharide/polyol phosphate export permease
VALAAPCLACCLLGGAFGLVTMAALPNQRSAMEIFQFLIIPQYVLGGVLVPVHGGPAYLAVLARAMPMRYVVGLTRDAFYAGLPGYRQVAPGSAVLNTAVTIGLLALFLAAGTAIFGYRERAR